MLLYALIQLIDRSFAQYNKIQNFVMKDFLLLCFRARRLFIFNTVHFSDMFCVKLYFMLVIIKVYYSIL